MCFFQKFYTEPDKLNYKINMINKSCEMIARIVNGLNKFSRSGEVACDGQYSLYDVAKT